MKTLFTSASVDGGGTEGFPDDGLANVGGDEKRDTWAKSIALLQQLVQQKNDESCHKQLQHKKNNILN